MKIYICDTCGNIFYVLKDSRAVPICCGKEMRILIANEREASLEKHIPTYSIKDNCVHISVGEDPHPMSKEHHICWIILETDKAKHLVRLKVDEEPRACVALSKDENIRSIYSYCNIHGLWVKKGVI